MRASLARCAPLAALLALASALAAEEAPAIRLSGSVESSFSLWEDRGSALVTELPAAAYSGAAALDFRAEAPARPDALSRCAFEGIVSIDAAGVECSFEARELWAEWRPASAIALRAGRQRLGFGSGFGWNPSNDLDPRRDASDPTAPRVGADAAQLRFEAGDAAGFPLSLSLVGILPAFEAGVELSDAKAGAQLYALAGELELMAAASASGLGGDSEAWLVGGWATLPVGPLVLGLEGAAKKRGDLYRPDAAGNPLPDRDLRFAATATATLRWGDFVAVAEANWDEAAYSREELKAMLASHEVWADTLSRLSAGSVGELHALGRITWSCGDWSAAGGALVDLGTGAFVASLEAASSIQGVATLELEITMPGSAGLLEDDELGLSGRGWSARASIAVNF